MDRDESGAYAQLTLDAFTEALASAQPVPGGGSASAIAGSLAASLLAMVARLSTGRPRYAAYADTHQRALDVGETARTQFLALADADAAVFRIYTQALKLPHGDETESHARDTAIHDAAIRAAEVPLEVVRLCHQVCHELEEMAGRSNLNAASDLDVGGLLCHAAARGAGANVVINLDAVPDSPEAGPMLAELHDRMTVIGASVERVHEQVQARALREAESA